MISLIILIIWGLGILPAIWIINYYDPDAQKDPGVVVVCLLGICWPSILAIAAVMVLGYLLFVKIPLGKMLGFR